MVFALLAVTALAADKDFIVTGDPAGYTYDNGVLTFTGPGDYTVSMATPGATSTTNRIIVAAGTAENPVNITLDGVKIQSGFCALEIKENPQSYLNLTLPEGTTNILSSADYYPGIKCTEGATLSINGTGALTANGGYNSAGIGGGGSTGIGRGGDITINGGTVTANGGSGTYGGAGIGGGGFNIYFGDVNITISGGTVKAAGGSGADDLGLGESGSGSVTLKNKTAAQGGIDVYLTTITLENVHNVTAVASLTAALNSVPYTYGTTDMFTDAQGKLYLYLPADTQTTEAQTSSGTPPVTRTYTGAVTTLNNHTGEGTLNAAASTDKTLISITEPAAVTGVANGTAKTAADLGLPAEVTLVTDDGNVQADVTWDVEACSYDPDNSAEQTFTVYGTVALPDGVINPNGVHRR